MHAGMVASALGAMGLTGAAAATERRHEENKMKEVCRSQS
jgi:hypothetical protein